MKTHIPQSLHAQEKSGAVLSLWQWLNINPLVNLIQLIIGGSLLVLLLTYYIRSVPATPWRFWLIILLLGGIGALARWITRQYGETPGIPVTLLWVGITFALTEGITIITNGEFPRILYALLPIIAIVHLPRRWALLITIGTVFWVAISSILLADSRDGYLIQTLILNLTIYLAGFGLAHALLQERHARQEAQDLLRELAESNEQLTRYAAEAAQAAAMRERNRIAREIHDSLGHYLTVVGVQLEKAIAFDGVNQEALGQAVRAAKQLTDQALTEVRNSVSTLRETDEHFTLYDALKALVSNVQQSGLSVNWRYLGDEAGFSEQQLLTLFRAAQEGLTNVQKHAGASQAMITVELDAETAVLRLTDDGAGFAAATARGGYGLQGLRERVELVQGTIALEQAPSGGAQLTVKLPREITS